MEQSGTDGLVGSLKGGWLMLSSLFDCRHQFQGRRWTTRLQLQVPQKVRNDA